MVKFKKIGRSIKNALVALCVVFVTNSAWAEYTITVNQNGGTGSNLLSTLYATPTDEYIDYGGVSYDPLCFMYIYEAEQEGETEDTSCIIAGNVYADYYLVNITNNSYHNYSLPTKTGYNFNGYWSATSGGTQYINANGQALDAFVAYDATNDFTIYAQWTPNQITITWYGVATAGTGFTAVSGQANTYTSTVSYGGDITTPGAGVQSAGQTFLGWKFEK